MLQKSRLKGWTVLIVGLIGVAFLFTVLLSTVEAGDRKGHGRKKRCEDRHPQHVKISVKDCSKKKAMLLVKIKALELCKGVCRDLDCREKKRGHGGYDDSGYGKKRERCVFKEVRRSEIKCRKLYGRDCKGGYDDDGSDAAARDDSGGGHGHGHGGFICKTFVKDCRCDCEDDKKHDGHGDDDFDDRT